MLAEQHTAFNEELLCAGPVTRWLIYVPSWLIGQVVMRVENYEINSIF